MFLEGPDFVALQVHNLEASAAFYTNVIGLVPAPKSPPGAAVFQTKPIPFAVRRPQEALPEDERLGIGVSLWFYTPNASVLYDHLTQQGVSIVKPLTDAPGPFGRWFTFTDLDGYAITVHDGR